MQGQVTPCIRVYLVEDEALLRESLHAVLELEPGIDVVGEAGDAELAIQEVETLEVDIVLMDVQLPGVDGIEATRLLKQRRPDLAVVMLSSYSDDYVGAAFDAGASGYILKSYKRQDLVQALRAARQGQVPIDPSLTGGLVRQLTELRKVHRGSELSPRQVEILRMVANGGRYKDIAGALFVSESTINREMRNIYDRLDVKDAPHAVSVACKKGLI